MLGLALLASLATANAYVWPSPKLDALEAMRWDQDDTINGVASFMQPCTFFVKGNEDGTETGRANGPDWIRTAYHDMATHNVADGTGGLDASIRFAEEQSRGENAGTGFLNTIEVLVAFTSRHISIADMIAIGLITVVENCQGPEIAFRGGRIDATEPNKPGVPEPQQDLESHIASFARQGFTKTEMIGLVACGHSFGGVQHAPFPDVVPELNDPQNTQSVAHFDTTFSVFDNNVVTEYLESTTTNPLIIAKNDTFNSDKRIFASDGNATMLSFGNSPSLFESTCATLFARMLDTVPSGVELTEVIDPLPVKPDLVELLLEGDKLLLSGAVRLFNVSGTNTAVVRMLWDDRAGPNPDNNVELVPDRTTKSMGGRIISNWYVFKGSSEEPGFIPLDPAAGILNMRFTVDGKLEDQDGLGFAVEDRVVFSNSSCLTSDTPPVGRFNIAVRNGFEPTRLFLEREVKDATNHTTVEETDIARPATPVAAGSAYSLWSIEVTDDSNQEDGKIFTIGAEAAGAKFSTIDTHNVRRLPPCTA
ncbi:heme peroxidase [Mycena rebaudengoi]|nr:heme peroxidase [Mycena rebaudengoi]